MTNTEIISDPKHFYDIIFDPENEISGIRSLGELNKGEKLKKFLKIFLFLGNGMVAVNYKKQSDFEEVNGNTNVVIAAFVTAQARLLLFSYIEKLGERIFYFDTGIITKKEGFLKKL